ncbi:hypothetical protein ABID21_001013 [Pseudorhizobium tarimense]|uniref:Uncharacterized protein n=1 Tax=Pseudorhizobium tarimense TaxID=1079109 RepID=A0ABV2H3C3_9HYPH|nr:hypothetical protein [Pseudorhizobium tarimense]
MPMRAATSAWFSRLAAMPWTKLRSIFQFIYAEADQTGERGVAGAEIIDGKPEARFLQPRQFGACDARVEGRFLSDLHSQTSRIDAGCGHDLFQQGCNRIAGEFAGETLTATDRSGRPSAGSWRMRSTAEVVPYRVSLCEA